jgi:hypothetical protein
MFEPYQTALALQAKPYFINSFIRHRMKQSEKARQLLTFYEVSGDKAYLQELRSFLVSTDHLPADGDDRDLVEVLQYAQDLLKYRQFNEAEGSDGLDGVRHNLRMLKQAGLPDTKLIICSMEGPQNYPAIDKLVVEREFADVVDRLIITAEPGYLARFTSTNQVVSYQRRFMAAAATATSAP